MKGTLAQGQGQGHKGASGIKGSQISLGSADKTGQPQAPCNSSVVSGNQSPWTGEPWANHWEPGHGKSGKCLELRKGREVSTGVRADPEASGSKT